MTGEEVGAVCARVLGGNPLTRAFVFNKCHTCRNYGRVGKAVFIKGKTCLTVRHISAFRLLLSAQRLAVMIDRWIDPSV